MYRYHIWQNAWNRTRVAATAARCATIELPPRTINFVAPEGLHVDGEGGVQLADVAYRLLNTPLTWIHTLLYTLNHYSIINNTAVLRIHIYYYADPDLGSKKCPYGSGSGS